MIDPQDGDVEQYRLDRSFLVFGILLCFWGLSEYMFPPSKEAFDRTVPKLVHASIFLWSILGVINDYRNSKRPIHFRNITIFGAILSVILIIFPMFIYDSRHDELWPFLAQKFYSGCYITEWYVVLLYCSIHIQAHPGAYRSLLKLVPVITVIFFMASRRHTNITASESVSEEFQSGIYAGYYLVALFPFIWDVKNKILKFVLIILVVYGVINSMKRGAMLCLFSSMFLALLTYYIFFAQGIKRIPYFFALTVLSALLAGAVVYSISQKKAAFDHRMENIQSGSGRLSLYEYAWQTYKTFSPREKLFGAESSSEQIRAHNDFLFVLVSYGLVGLSVFVFFNLGLLLIALQGISTRFSFLPSLLVSLGNVLIIEMISYGLEGHAFVICCAYVGLMQGTLLAEDEEPEEIIEEEFEEDGEFAEYGDEVEVYPEEPEFADEIEEYPEEPEYDDEKPVGPMPRNRYLEESPGYPR